MQFFAFECGGASLLRQLFTVTSENIIVTHTLPKSRFWTTLSFRCRQYGSNFNHCDVIGPQRYRVWSIMQNGSQNMVQGRSRSPISVPMESPYVKFLCVSNSNFPVSCTVSEMWHNIGPIFTVVRVCPWSTVRLAHSKCYASLCCMAKTINSVS